MTEITELEIDIKIMTHDSTSRTENMKKQIETKESRPSKKKTKKRKVKITIFRYN